MSRPLTLCAAWTCISTIVAGCSPTQPFYFHEDGDLSHYKHMATEIEYPDVETCSLAEVEATMPPLTLDNFEDKEIWNLCLEEAVQFALANSKVMRSLGGQVTFGGQTARMPEQLLRAPESIPTVYNPAIVESNPNTGVEGALSAFDAQFASSVFWERNERPVNVRESATGIFARDFQQDRGTFQAELSKTAATGTTFALRNNTVYDLNNNPTREVPSDWSTNMEAEIRQPLLRGSGVDFNRIVGPISSQPTGFYPEFNGVVLARINMDIELADFEAGVRNLVSDVENDYWELYFAYRRLDAVVTGRDAALQNWRQVKALADEGAKGGEADKEAQARREYFRFRSEVESALRDLFATEARLRYLIGLAVADCRLIRPCDEPTTARVEFDWCQIHAEGLARSPELRRQKWLVKRRELELVGAKNFLLPRLDAVAQYRWQGLGDDLIDSDGRGVTGATSLEGTDAASTLLDGTYQEWQLGLQMSMPLGFRQELAGVRNRQLLLARERSVLQDQELTLSHQLAEAIRDLQINYVLSQTNFNLWVASRKEVEAVRAAYDAGTVTYDTLLNAFARRADAENLYYRSVVDYNKAIYQVHLRKGSLLEYNNVHLAEGPWPGKAYFDAHKRARERDSGEYIDYGYTRPQVFSRGPVPQAGVGPEAGYIEQDGVPAEMFPAPEPDPISTEPELEGETNGAAEQVTSAGTGPVAEVAFVSEPRRFEPQGRASLPMPTGSADRGDQPSEVSALHEAVTYQPAAEAPRSASGWRRAQR